MEQMIKLLLDSYGLETLLEENDITQEVVVEILVNRRLINLEDYFEPEEDND